MANACKSLVRADNEHGMTRSACHIAGNNGGSWSLGNVAEGMTQS